MLYTESDRNQMTVIVTWSSDLSTERQHSLCWKSPSISFISSRFTFHSLFLWHFSVVFYTHPSLWKPMSHDRHLYHWFHWFSHSVLFSWVLFGRLNLESWNLKKSWTYDSIKFKLSEGNLLFSWCLSNFLIPK